MARAGRVDEVKLRVAVPLDPDGSRGNPLGAAHRDEQAGKLLAIAPAVGQGLACTLQFAVSIFDLIADRVVDRLDFLPAPEASGRLLGKPDDLRIP